eukprot:7412751-Heterocapsa_arctica.AAC.1
MAEGLETTFEPPPLTAAAARGHWILDSGASDHLVGKVNLTKKDLKAVTLGGPSVLLSTANGIVERSARTSQPLPDGVGRLAPVEALIMNDMDCLLYTSPSPRDA